MSDSNFTKILQRIVGQVRFAPTLSTWQDTVEISKQFEEKYEHWKIENRQDVTLFSPNEKKLLQIQYNSVLYLNEGSEDLAELKDQIVKSYSALNSGGDFKHLGFRNLQILGMKFKFNELVELLHEKIYTREILSIASDEVNDVLFSAHSTKNGIRNNVMLGPVTKDEGVARFSSQFGIEAKLPQLDRFESFLLVDVDTFFTNGSDVGKIDELLLLNQEIMDGYIKFFQ